MLNLQQRKVLLVLEDKAVATFISAALDQAGCRHAVSSCDSSAFFRLQTDHYDLILLDIDDGSPKRLEMLEKAGSSRHSADLSG